MNWPPLGFPAQFKIFDHGSDSYDHNLVDCIAGTCDWTGTERFNDACL